MDLATGRRNRVPVAQLSGARSASWSRTRASSAASASSKACARSWPAATAPTAQLRIYNANRDIVEVVRDIADATEIVPVDA